MGRSHQLLVEGVPRTGKAADVAAPLPLAVVLRSTFGVERSRFRSDVIDRQINYAKVTRYLAHSLLEKAGTVDPEFVIRSGIYVRIRGWRIRTFLIGWNDSLYASGVERIICHIPMRIQACRPRDYVAKPR